MTVWDDVKALFGEGGFEVVTAVDHLTIRTFIQLDADSIIWMPDYNSPNVDAAQLTELWQKHLRAIDSRMAWLQRLIWMIQKGGLLLIPLPLLSTLIWNAARGSVDNLINYAFGFVTSAILLFFRRQLANLVARIGGRFLQGRLQKHLQKYLSGHLTSADYGIET